MERIYLLPREGTFYKANLHCHSVISDGKKTIEELKDMYQKHGYSVLAYTDHRRYRDHRNLSDETFLALAGYEADVDWETEDYNHYATTHICLYDTDPDQHREEKTKSPMPQGRDTAALNAFAKEMGELGFLLCYNHPYWSLQTYEDYKGLRGFFAMEIYNHGCELDGLYGYHAQAYDEMLRTGNRLACVASDDNHNCFPEEDPMCDCFGGFTMIKAKELSYPAIIDALRRGDFYASTGPEIKEFYLEGNQIVVKTSPVCKIYVKGSGRLSYQKLSRENEFLTEAVFELDPNRNDRFLRVSIQDERGRHADSRAYFLDEMN